MLQSSLGVTLAVVFLIGVALFSIGVALPGRIASPQAPWPMRLDDSATGLDNAAKIELIERMGLVGSAWCEEILRQADSEEGDPTVRRAIAFALADCKQAALDLGRMT
ncbi:MAG: hypothetical protein M3126_04980 [Candidatus Eremiobacteraeota bacterium]|nr:hypothetical protein [Candidatus Eremiobacteraeota bacterium]